MPAAICRTFRALPISRWGTRIADLTRPVNVRDFHVGLHVIFSSRKAHDEYQVDARHQQFIAENKDSWQQVRVFDCLAS